ncbi:PREDICTED: mannose-6-phosphate isomerase-like [Priapulus caudatus]|uniref:mannose-6-phosphate isomerase n=1 Tax=Priapulus caudatus TaxID=37621 RepID=A0ABM1DXM7_PRICU|nr:PREDICTED: mannose-6-phosphate isomerase-like [Priapulus caudatus]
MPGVKSDVARLVHAANQSFTIEDTQNYAELWMGTHQKGPSVIAGTGTSLQDWIREHPESLGAGVAKKFGGELPFLLKVLSVNISLSIQAHPSKEHAEELHKNDPKNYPDANHKPEMAIALTPFEGMCGFRPASEIAKNFKDISELAVVSGSDNVARFLEAIKLGKDAANQLKICFTALMNCPKIMVEEQLRLLRGRLDVGDGSREPLTDLFLRIYKQFPGDVGCFVIYYLNHMQLQPGEAMFLGPNVPHAYLYGDCMECMACSDNTIRAGLTPKFIDVTTLCDMLDYQCKSIEDNKFHCVRHSVDPYVEEYNPPVPDFAVAKIELPSDVREYQLEARGSASIVLTIHGSADASNPTLRDESIQIMRGTVIFVSAGETVSLKIKSDGILMFRALSPI